MSSSSIAGGVACWSWFCCACRPAGTPVVAIARCTIIVDGCRKMSGFGRRRQRKWRDGFEPSVPARWETSPVREPGPSREIRMRDDRKGEPAAPPLLVHMMGAALLAKSHSQRRKLPNCQRFDLLPSRLFAAPRRNEYSVLVASTVRARAHTCRRTLVRPTWLSQALPSLRRIYRAERAPPPAIGRAADD